MAKPWLNSLVGPAPGICSLTGAVNETPSVEDDITSWLAPLAGQPAANRQSDQTTVILPAASTSTEGLFCCRTTAGFAGLLRWMIVMFVGVLGKLAPPSVELNENRAAVLSPLTSVPTTTSLPLG